VGDHGAYDYAPKRELHVRRNGPSTTTTLGLSFAEADAESGECIPPGPDLGRDARSENVECELQRELMAPSRRSFAAGLLESSKYGIYRVAISDFWRTARPAAITAHR